MNRRLVALLATTAFVLAALGIGWWGLLDDRDEHAHGEDGSPAAWTAAGAGWVRVTGVTDRTMTAMQMPGMATMPDPDPVPDGFTRISVDVELAAGQSQLRWRPADFVITGRGTDRLTPHRVTLGDGIVPAGTRVAGGLIFDVPTGATGLSLAFDGGSPYPLASFHHAGDGHGDHHHD